MGFAGVVVSINLGGGAKILVKFYFVNCTGEK